MNDIYSFFQLINQYKVEIPIIQRDYAQGRENPQAVDIRKSIIESMIKATNDEIPLSFDFVYGRIDDDFFIPFDGQQRLTTLFLFHLYAFNLCNFCNECSCLGVLKRFSYRTRQSAREFCEKLVTEKIIPNDKGRISVYIQEQSWFYPEWMLDPTIAGMLNMLEEIHTQYPKNIASHDKIAKLLTSGCICPITFHFVDMGKQKLQDSTYIKMNARGKTLTAFENFKVSLEQDLRKDVQDSTKSKEVLDIFLGSSDEYKLQDGVDGAWLNFFWNEINLENDIGLAKKLPDSAIYSYFRRHLYNLWTLHSENLGVIPPEDKIELDGKIDFLNKKLGSQLQDTDFISYDIYKQVFKGFTVNETSISGIDKLSYLMTVFSAFTFLVEKRDEIVKATNSFQIDTNGSMLILGDWSNGSETIRSRVIFFAFMKYVEKIKDVKGIEDFTTLGEVMRVVWNLTIDPTLRSHEVMVKVMQSISFMIDKFAESQETSFYVWLSNESFAEDSSTTERQMQHEIIKAKLITKGREYWKPALIKAEQNQWLKADLRFLLTNNENTQFSEFQEHLETTFEIFPDNPESTVDYLWVRAMLACSDEILLDQGLTLSDKPFDNWRALINNRCMDAFRKLLEKCKGKNTKETMTNLCDDYQRSDVMPWLYPLIQKIPNSDQTLLDCYSESKKIQKYDYYGQDSDKQVYLYNKTIWSEKNIILTPYRNEIIRQLLISENGVDLSVNNKNISNYYFSGWDINLNQTILGTKVDYCFTRDTLKVGIREEALSLSESIHNKMDKAIKDKDGWGPCKIFNFSNEVRSDEDISFFLQKVQDWVTLTFVNNSHKIV